MNVILLDHVEGLGTVGQTVKVKNGYARNYLLPRKLACQATDKNLNFYRTIIEAKQKKLAKAKASAQQLADQLSAVTITFVRKARGEEAKLFGSVTPSDIAGGLEAKGFDIDRKRIVLSEPIKKLGEHKAVVRVHPEVTAMITIIVNPEEEPTDAV
jgi:large subunit ribosomal protein L9